MSSSTDVDTAPVRELNLHTAASEPKSAGNVAWHTLEAADVLRRLGTHPTHGLEEAAVGQRQAVFGPNELVEQGIKSAWRLLREQLTATMVLVLLAAAIVSALLGDYSDTAAGTWGLGRALGYSSSTHVSVKATLRRWRVRGRSYP